MPKIIIASGPVIVEDNKVLLDQHGDTPFWKFCGGRVENKETTLIETAKRKAKEEMGIEIEILNSTPFLMHTFKQNEDGDCDVILAHYLAKRIGKISPGADIRKWKWIPLAKLAHEELAPNILPALKHFGFLKIL